MLIAIIIGIVVLSVLIIVHELGHFITAKASGIWVEEFGLGFPPRLYGKKWGDTVYSINWIPFGGFNKLSGEVDPSAPRSLASKGYSVRLLVLSGGILMNILLPFVLLSMAFMIPHDVVTGQIVVEDVNPGSPAAMAGIEPGDTLLSVNDKPLNSVGDLARYIQLNLGKEITISVKHSDLATEEVKLVPRWRPPEGQGAIGILYRTVNPTIVSESYPFWQAIPIGVRSCIETLVLYKNGIIGVIIGTVPLTPAGPVGIVHVTSEVAQAGISPLLELVAFISIAIAITQLIPFPALDGGRILFVLLQMIRRGKRVSVKTEEIVHLIGFFTVLAIAVAITYQDIIRIITGES
ncbi:MAG: M50 family metallopeptidase, partial [Dehalococcoidia bacterium]|nr:M50 family metallopeptidase [Dehalococcoidia bacterium]